MRKIAHIIVHNLKLVAADRPSLFWLLVMPVVFTAVAGIALPGGGGGGRSSAPVRYALTVANLDAGPHGDRLLETIKEGDEIDLIVVDTTNADQEARSLVESGDRSAALIIPADFSARIDAGQGAALAFHQNPERMNPLVTRQAVEKVVARLNVERMAARGARSAYAHLWEEPSERVAEKLTARVESFVSDNWEPAPIEVVTERLGRQVEREVGPMGFSHAAPAMALMFVLLNGLMMSTLLVEERRDRTLVRLFTAPLRRSEIIAANLGWRFVVGMLQVWFLIGLGAAVFRVDWGDSAAALLLLTVTYVAAVSGLSVLIGSTARSSRRAESLSLVLALAMCALGGLWWPLEITPEAYQRIGHFAPAAWAMDGMQNLVSRGYGLAQIAPQALVLAAFAVGFGVLAVVTFRYE